MADKKRERGVFTIGGKGNPLSPSSVFHIAKNYPIIEIDGNLSGSGSGSGGSTFELSVPSFLTGFELRASLVVLLNKLSLLVPPPPSSENLNLGVAACSCLLDFLNNDSQDQDSTTTLVFKFSASASASGSDVVDEQRLTYLWSDALLLGISSLLDCESSSLCTIALVASSLSSQILSSSSNNIPSRSHACLLSVSKSLHSSTQAELLNSSSATSSPGEVLLPLLSSLALALQNTGKASWTRSSKLPNIIDTFYSKCPTIPNLDHLIKSFFNAYLDNDYVKSFHLIHALSDLVRNILSWEAATSFLILVQHNSPMKVVNPRKKGTPVVLIQYIKGILQFEEKTFDEFQLLSELLSRFSFEHHGFDCLVQNLKDIVDTNESKRPPLNKPKPPKGTRDFAKEQMALREILFSIIRTVCKKHGATALDTPAFELRETLTEKYGEDSKLIYDLADQGGELCSLRYDLTIPFARYVAQNGLTSFRRYQIGKVYRRDNPAKGRLREFYQCDFDIAGDKTIAADFEVIKILIELLNELKIGDYEIKLNHRKLLDGMLSICGVPSDKVRTICSSIDKLDKQPLEQIKKEMVDEKGLDAEAADKIGSYVMQRGHPLTLLDELKKEGSDFLKYSASSDALNDLEILFEALKRARCIDKVVLDMSLARGLDYYTGVIFEAVFKGDTQIGSIAAGGRYDNLIGMFGSKHVPAVGISLGIERVFTIMEQLQKDTNQGPRATETQVLVSILGDDIPLAAELVNECWEGNLNAEFMVHKRVTKHFDRAKESQIPWMVIVGDRDIGEDQVKLKDMVANDKGVVVNKNVFVEELVKRINTGGMSS